VKAQPLRSGERALLDLLLSRDFPGRAELVRQAETVRTAGLSCSCGCPSFSLLADRSLPPARVAYADRMVSDAHGTDPGGNEVVVLLFTEDGYLSEVEVYSVEGDDFGGLPQPDSLKLSEWSEPNESGVQHLLNP
jgi:hypothetical protein